MRLGDERAKLLAGSVTHDGTIARLVLRHNRLTYVGFSQVLTQASAPKLVLVDLCNNSIGRQGCELLCATLKVQYSPPPTSPYC